MWILNFELKMCRDLLVLNITKSLHIFNSKLFPFGHSWEKLIEWLADNKFNYLNWYWRESSLLVALNIHTFHINLIQADLEASDLIDHGQLSVQCIAESPKPPCAFDKNYPIHPRAPSSRSFSLRGLFLESPENFFGSERPVVKLQSPCFEQVIFQHVFNARITKKVGKFGGLEPRCCEGIMAPEIGPRNFGTSEKQAPGARFSKVPKFFGRHNSLCIFKTKVFGVTKLCSYFNLYSLYNIWNDQLHRISASVFYEWLFVPVRFSGLLRNARQERHFYLFLESLEVTPRPGGGDSYMRGGSHIWNRRGCSSSRLGV